MVRAHSRGATTLLSAAQRCPQHISSEAIQRVIKNPLFMRARGNSRQRGYLRVELRVAMRPFVILLVTVTSATAGELRCPTQEQIPNTSFSVDGRTWKLRPDMGLRYVSVMHGDEVRGLSYVTCGRGTGEYSTSTRGKNCRFVKDQNSKIETLIFDHGQLEKCEIPNVPPPRITNSPGTSGWIHTTNDSYCVVVCDD
jgi:hypothetical protein